MVCFCRWGTSQNLCCERRHSFCVSLFFFLNKGSGLHIEKPLLPALSLFLCQSKVERLWGGIPAKIELQGWGGQLFCQNAPYSTKPPISAPRIVRLFPDLGESAWRQINKNLTASFGLLFCDLPNKFASPPHSA